MVTECGNARPDPVCTNGAVPFALSAIGWIAVGREWGDALMDALYPPIGAAVAAVFWLVVFWRNPYYAWK